MVVATWAEVVKRLQDLCHEAQVVEQKIWNVEPGSFGAELDLQQEFTKVKKMIDSIISDAQNTTTIDDENAQEVVKILQEIVATVVKFLLDLISKAPKFSSIEKSIIRRDLESIGKSITSLEKILLDKCPEKYQDAANELKQKTDAMLAAAIGAYS